MPESPSSFGPLVDAAWLREHLDDGDVVVVDSRFDLTDPPAAERGWRAGHIPGAPFLDVGRDLSGAQRGDGADGGRHPLPEPADFEKSARRAGISGGSRVVACDETGEGGAARLWWLLRHFGHDAVAVLDGGVQAWREAGGRLASGAEEPAPGGFTARPRSGDTLSAEEVLDQGAGPDGLRLLDARSPERFRGESEPVDPVAGHIPGAENVHFRELMLDGRMLTPEELRERLGEQPFVASCGSGITASVLVLAAERAGVETRLYPGSFSEWSRRGLSVERGE